MWRLYVLRDSDPSVLYLLLGVRTVNSLDVVDEWRERGVNRGTLEGSSNGDMTLSSRAAWSSAAQRSFSASHEAARSKL